jgi:23S rRNA (adenine1618-N6)-methyltransferase
VSENKNQIYSKTNLHPRNKHREAYDFQYLRKVLPELGEFVKVNEYGNESIDFFNPEAVKALNFALLKYFYKIENWGIPPNYLCPPIPGRADYIHHLADLLANSNNGTIPEGENVIGLDVGIGANCVYPIIGNHEYQWSFVGTDIDENALQNCKKIIAKNPHLIEAISLQLQVEPRFIFKNIILPEDKFAFTICNPPFHASQDEATKASLRKVNNLEDTKSIKPILNFGTNYDNKFKDLSFVIPRFFYNGKDIDSFKTKKEAWDYLGPELKKLVRSCEGNVDFCGVCYKCKVYIYQKMTDQKGKII